MVSFKDAALEILKRVDEPLTVKEITDTALQEELIITEGQTPEATMGAQLYNDIRNNKNSSFIKVGRGKFTLKNKKDSAFSPLILIEKHNENVKTILKEKLHNMDPYHFEFLIGDLLQNIGYEDINVTKRSGDGGIDIKANLTVGGITNVKTVIQVKRFRNNIPGKIITQLRGSAEVDQRGLVITTSDFTKDAILESKAPNKMPVALVNGKKLIKLLFKYSVGVKNEEITVHSFDNEYFQNEIVISNKSVSDKNRSIWPLPGGASKYIETLNKFLETIDSGINTKKKLVEWYKNNFENVQSDKTAEGYIFVPKSMGLIDVKDGFYYLTENGIEYLKNKDSEFLYNIISKNILAFDEILEFLRTSNEPQKEQDILDYLKENLDIEWTTFAQINFRLLWLLNLNKIIKLDDGYNINS